MGAMYFLRAEQQIVEGQGEQCLDPVGIECGRGGNAGGDNRLGWRRTAW